MDEWISNSILNETLSQLGYDTTVSCLLDSAFRLHFPSFTLNAASRNEHALSFHHRQRQGLHTIPILDWDARANFHPTVVI